MLAFSALLLLRQPAEAPSREQGGAPG